MSFNIEIYEEYCIEHFPYSEDCPGMEATDEYPCDCKDCLHGQELMDEVLMNLVRDTLDNLAKP